MATLDPIEKEVANLEAYFTDGDGRVILIHHQPETLSADELGRAVLVAPATKRLSLPAVSATEQAAMFVVDGNLEWRIETRELVVDDEMLSRMEAE